MSLLFLVYPQPHSILPVYDTDVLENSPKMVILVQLLELSVANGDRMLIFRCNELSATVYVCMRERERQRERQTERETEREKERERERCFIVL